MYFEENKRRPSKMGKTKTGGTIREQEKNIKEKERYQRNRRDIRENQRKVK